MAVLYWKPCYNKARYNEVGLYIVYINHEPVVTLTYFMARST